MKRWVTLMAMATTALALGDALQEDIYVPTERFTAYTIEPPGADLLLDLKPAAGYRILWHGIRFQDYADCVQWIKDETGVHSYKLYIPGVDQTIPLMKKSSREWLVVTGECERITSSGGVGGEKNDPLFEADVLAVNLDFVNDKLPDGSDNTDLTDETREETVGAYVELTGPLIPLIIRKIECQQIPEPVLRQMPVKFEQESQRQVKVWANATRTGTPITLPKTYHQADLPVTVYVEPLEASAAERDLVFKVGCRFEKFANAAGSAKRWVEAIDRVTMTVLKVELANAWETDDVCNRVLNPKQTTSNRLFVATESNDQAQITVKATIQPAGVEDKVLCAIYDGSTHLVSTGFSAACEADMSFAPTGPAKNYTIRVGLDSNGNGTLESSEFYTTVTNFNVTAFTSAHYNDQRSSLSDEMDVVKYIYPVGASLLIHFLNRTDQAYPFNATNSIGINCFTQGNLTYNAGETFAPGGNGTLDEFVWYASSAASEKIANSDEVKGAINSVLAAHRSEVTNFFATNPTATVYEASWNQSNIATNFAETREWMLDEYDLHVAYGHATISSMTVSVVVKKDGSTIYTDSLIVTGVLTDLYDFNYEDGGRAGKAAVLQIGWDPDITGRDAGNIYFDKANFQETFDEWDFTY